MSIPAATQRPLPRIPISSILWFEDTRYIQESEKLCPQTGTWYLLMWSLGTAFLVVATRNWDPAIMCP